MAFLKFLRFAIFLIPNRPDPKVIALLSFHRSCSWWYCARTLCSLHNAPTFQTRAILFIGQVYI
jgi:hypothetical protein